MTLMQYLDTLPENQKIRIGTKFMGGFVYVGTTGNIKTGFGFEEKRSLLEKILSGLMNVSPDQKTRDSIHWLVDEYLDCESIGNREVITTYRGIMEPEMIVIIIPGKEKTVEYTGPITRCRMVNEAAEKLVMEVYREICRELIRAYRKADEFVITENENSIRRNVYGILNEPQALIDACRKCANIGAKGRKKQIV